MKIFICTEISDELVNAFHRLIPQLNPVCNLPTRDDLDKIIKSDETYLVIAREKEIVGTLTLIINKSPSGEKAWIEDVVVDSRFRGKGIAMKMLDFAIKLARDKGVSKIDLTSNPSRASANNLYPKLGFEQRETNVYRKSLE